MSKSKKKKQVRKKVQTKEAAKSTESQRTLGDQRQATKSRADKMKETAQESYYPEITLLYSYVSYSFRFAISLVKSSKGKKLNVLHFIAPCIGLDEFLHRAKELCDKKPKRLQVWPENPGITFSTVAGISALQVAMKFSWNVQGVVMKAWIEAIGPQHQNSFDNIVFYPKSDPRFLKWRDLAVQELNKRIIPPEWKMWEINRDADSFRCVLSAEFEKALNETRKKEELVTIPEFIMSDTVCKSKEDINSIREALRRVKKFIKENPGELPEFPKPKKESAGSSGAKYARKDLRQVWPFYCDSKFGGPITRLK